MLHLKNTNKDTRCAHYAPYATKALRKAMMKRTYLEKHYFKKQTTESSKKFQKQIT